MEDFMMREEESRQGLFQEPIRDAEGPRYVSSQGISHAATQELQRRRAADAGSP